MTFDHIVVCFLLGMFIPQVWNEIQNYKAHKRILKTFVNHKEAIEALNKLTKTLEQYMKSSAADLKQLRMDSADYSRRIDAIEKVLLDPKFNLEKFRTEKLFEKAKTAVKLSRAEFIEEQKAIKDKLRSKTKPSQRSKEQ